MWGSDRPVTRFALRRLLSRVPTQVLLFGSVTVVLLGCWGGLKLAPGPGAPVSVSTASTIPDGTITVTTVREIPPNQTAAEARAQRENAEIRLLQLEPLSVAIRQVVGPQMSRTDLYGLAIQVIELCDAKAEARDHVIARGVPSTKVKAVIEAACPTV